MWPGPIPPRFLYALPLIGCLAAIGCGTKAPDATPAGAVAAFASALARGALDEAYGMMSPAYRERVTLETFRERVRRYPEEVKSLAAQLRRPVGDVVEQAEVELAAGQRLTLRRSGGGWRLDTDVVDFYSQATPRAALKSFVRAVEQARWDVILRLIPNADRQDMTAQQLAESMAAQLEEVQRTTALLKASLDQPIEVVGERATMPYGERFAVRFLREDGVWKIEDPE